MKRFAVTICLAACLVFLFGAVAMAQSQADVTVQSVSTAAGATASIGILVRNDLDIKQYVQPLKIVNVSGTSITSLAIKDGSATSRFNGRLGDIAIHNGYLTQNGTCLTTAPNVGFLTIDWNDNASHAAALPVGLMIVRGKIVGALTVPPGTDPPSDPSFVLEVGIGADCPGTFEVDTTCTNPANHLLMVKTTGTPNSLVPTFGKGTISVQCNPCPVNTTVLTNVSATVGSLASKALSATDDEADTFAKISGPGAVTTTTPGPPSAAGSWSYTPTCADVPGFDVVFEVYNSNGQGSCGSATFHVDVAPTPLVTSNCGAVSVHFGALASKTVGVSGGCPPYTYTLGGGAPGTVDANGNWLYQTSCQDVGSHPISIMVSDATDQQAACNFDLIVTNTAPTCSNPADVTAPIGQPLSITMGPVADGDGDPLTYSQSGTWPAWLSISGNKIVGARPSTDQNPAVVCFTVSDGCQTSTACCVNVLFESKYKVCIVDLDTLGQAILPPGYAHTFGGRNKTVGIWVDPATGSSGGEGGFDFLICYDQSILSFQIANRGADLDASFEYFTFRTGMFGGNCGGGCPDGFVKLVGIADMNNGVTPAPGAFNLSGVIATLTFFVNSNVNYIGLCPHVGFCSYDCGDNTISSQDGNTLFVPSGVGMTFGLDYTCVGQSKPGHEVNPFIDFCPGAICIDRPPDDRGDLNLNGIANEIADAVLYSQYFITGSTNVFDPTWRDVAILASDVNNDGLTLSVADLVYLIRIITGDAQPFPPSGSGFKMSPYVNSVDVVSNVTDGALAVRTNSNVDLGGALFVYRYSGLTIGTPTLVSGAGLTIKSRAQNGELRILVYGMTSGAKVPAGLNTVVNVPVTGNGTIELAESQVSDYNGALLTVNAMAKSGLPTSYALLQNYPNPFNAGTVIQFNLEKSSDWNLTIYNIAGQVVNTFAGNGVGTVSVAWNGTSESGSSVASGMYFYRLNTKDFTATKKMVLMK